MSDFTRKQDGVALTLRWLARGWSLVSIALLLLFLLGEPGDWTALTAGEWLMILLFPVTLVVGMILAWRWEIWGGAITVVGLIAFYLINFTFSGRLPEGPYLLLFAAPGFLFLLSGLWRTGLWRPSS